MLALIDVNASGSSASPMPICIVTIHDRNPHRAVRSTSTTGAQMNLMPHGRTSSDVSCVIVPTSTPSARRIAGSAHHTNPTGAPSLK